jgi:ATP adenylyltransferase
MVYVGGQEATPEGCFLCNAASADLASTDTDASLVVEQAELTVTVLNRFPYSSGHLMVAPRRHAPDLLAITPEEGAAMLAGTQRAIRALQDVMHPEGFNIGVNHGEAAGASVEHLHQHVVPRWSGDTNFMPVLGDVKVLPEHLQQTSQHLRAALAALG